MDRHEKLGRLFLSMDGCGTLGYAQLLILNALMHRIQREEGLKEAPRPCDRLDLIGGTGMGGLISLFIGRLGMGTIQAIIEYERFSSRVFGRKPSKFANGFVEKATATYSSETFEVAFREVARRAGHNPDDPMEEINGRCKVVLFAINARNTEVQAIRSYRVRSESNLPFTILQAARATMASPDLFSSVHVGNELYVSEFIGYFHNPIKLIMKEASYLFPEAEKVAGILSFGVGQRRVIGIPTNPSPKDRITVLAKIAEDCEGVHQETATRYKENGVYHRMNVDQGLQDVDSDEWKEFELIRQSTFGHLKQEIKTFEAIARACVRRIGGPLLRDLNYVPPPTNVFPPPPALSRNFTGRDDLVRELLSYHLESQKDTNVNHRISLLWGVAGIGKTQTSLKLWLEFRASHPDALVFFLDARSKTNLENGLRALIRAQDPHFWDKNHDDALKWLSTTKRKWFIILDNADDPDMDLSEYIPTGSGNHLAITSRNPDLRVIAPDSNHQVQTLDMDESVRLLLSSAQTKVTNSTQAHAKEIVFELQYHSLAIVQAGGYILKHGRLSEYIGLFRKQRDRMLLDKNIKMPGYEHSVYTTLQLPFDRLPDSTKTLLRILSFLNNSHIDEDIIEQSVSNSFVPKDADWMIDSVPPQRAEIQKAIDILSRLLISDGEWDQYNYNQLISPALQYSLLLLTETDQGQRFYSMHALVQSFLRFVLPKDKADMQSAAIRLITSHIRLDDAKDVPILHQKLIPHIKAVESYSPTPHILPIDLYLMAKVINNYGEMDTAAKYAILALQRIQDMSTSVSASEQRSNNRLASRVEMVLIKLWINQDKLDAAAELGEKSVKSNREMLGEEHPDTVESMHNLGLAWVFQGHYAKASEIQARCLEIRRKTLGEEHPDTVNSLSNRSLTLLGKGDYAKAVEAFSQLVSLQKKIFGEGHSETVASMHNLAFALGEEGRYAEAAGLWYQVVEWDIKLYGEKDAARLAAMGHWGNTLANQGKYAEAEGIQREALDAAITAFGDEHPRTMMAKGSLARTLFKQGEFSKAAKMHLHHLKSLKKTIGRKHPRTLASIINLARAYSELGNHSRVRKMQERVIKLCQRVLGEEHPTTLKALNDFGVTLCRSGDYLGAMDLQTRIVALHERVRGKEHPGTLTSMIDFAITLAIQSHYPQSHGLFEQVSELRMKVLGSDHPDTLKARGWYAFVSELQ